MFIIGIDPHKASHTAAVLDGHEQLVERDPRPRGSFATRSIVGVRGGLRTALLGDRGSDRHRRVVGSTTRRRGRDGVRCAAGALGAGAAPRQRAQRQDRHARRSLRCGRRVAALETAGRRPRGSLGGAATAREASPRPGRAPHPGDLSPPHPVVPARRRRAPQTPFRHQGRSRAAPHPTRRRGR